MTTPEEHLSIEQGRVRVSGIYARPPKPAATLVVAHGAGSGMDHPFLVGFTRAMNDLGFATLRFNFVYIENGRRAPDPAPFLEETWRAAFAAASDRAKSEPVWAGGKSLGGRIASMVVANGMPATGLVFLGYPLHPPGKPERIRDEHLYRIEIPMLFLEGTRDPFATPELLQGVIAKLGKRASLVSIEGGDHSFNVRSAKRDAREVGAGLAEPAAAFIRERSN
ncbi:MAG: alpha/beta hydrolase family protein [Actinomycetota bacterium]